MTAATSPCRQVRYQTFDEVLADAEACAARGAATSGNWSLGQIFDHIAGAMEKTVDGFGFSVSWPIRKLGQMIGIKTKVLREGMQPGFNLRGEAARALLPPDAVETQAGLEHLRRAIARIKAESERAPHPFFGELTREEADGIQLRHAEMHMSFVRADENSPG